MVRILKPAMLGVCLIGAVGCLGGERYRNLVDPCRIERYGSQARQAELSAFTPQVLNGRILDQTLWNHYFQSGTDKLNPSGYDKLDILVRRRPQPDARVFLATARDIPYDADKAEDFGGKRQELDAKRVVAVQRYLTAQTVGRPMAFDVLVHDPVEPYMHGPSARNIMQSHYPIYTGTNNGGGGGGGTTTGGGGGGSGGGTGGNTQATQQGTSSGGTTAGGSSGGGNAPPR